MAHKKAYTEPLTATSLATFCIPERNKTPEIVFGKLEARVGFEPTNGGFADLSLGPLGYRAESLSIANQPGLFGHALLPSPPAVPIFSRPERGSSLRARIAPILPGASD